MDSATGLNNVVVAPRPKVVAEVGRNEAEKADLE